MERTEANLKLTKKNFRTRLTKFKSFLEKYSNSQPQDATSIEELEERIKRAEECWLEFDKAQKSVELLYPTQNFDEERNEFEGFYYRYLSLGKNFLKQRTRQMEATIVNYQNIGVQAARIAQLGLELRTHRESELSSLREMALSRNSSNIEPSNIRFPLPKLDLLTFSGGYKEWLGFRDAFSAVINDNECIPKIQKLRYLRSYLKDEAARIIDNLETTENNYDVAWNLLKDRYNNQRLITQNHMQALFDLPAVVGESSVNLRHLLDNALRHVRALTVLNQPTDKWDTPLIFLIVSKLDRETRKEWEKSISNIEMPTFEQLSKFLRDRCQVLETITYTSDKIKSNQQSSVMTSKQTPTRKNAPTRTFLNTQTSLQCSICNDNHQVHHCTEFKKMQVSERREIVKKRACVFNCLRKNHLVSECKSGNCNSCNRRHHTSLHLETNSTQANDTSKQAENSKTVNNFHIQDASKVLLSTAIISVFADEGGEHACRVLLDNGSQPNIISKDLVNRLGLKRKKSNLSVEVLNNMQTSCNEWVDMKIKSNTSNYATKLSFLILPQITGNVPAEPIDKKEIEIPKHVKLADPHFNQPLQVEALIGAEVFYDLLMVGRITLSKPGISIQNTRLG